MIRTIPSDLRDAARLFRRAPLFGAAAVLILALGTGATSAILSMADKALIRPLPIPDVSRVMHRARSRFRISTSAISRKSTADSRRSRPGAIRRWRSSTAATPYKSPVHSFRVIFVAEIGQQPVAGRLLNRSDDVTGAPATGVMSERLWTRVFRRDPQIVGCRS